MTQSQCRVHSMDDKTMRQRIKKAKQREKLHSLMKVSPNWQDYLAAICCKKQTCKRNPCITASILAVMPSIQFHPLMQGDGFLC